jgi:hypothetical protein
MVDGAVMSDPSMKLNTVITGTTLVGSPALYSEDRIITINVDDFLEKIVEDSDLAALSAAKAAIQHAAQNLMKAVDKFDALMYKHCASAEVDSLNLPCSSSFRTRKPSNRGAIGEQGSIGIVKALFQVQRMTRLDLMV